MKMIRLMGGALALLLLITILILYRSLGWAQFEGRVRAASIDLAHPDALIRSKQLVALPKDLLRVPLLRDLLTEDFVFYYEEHPDRLGLNGAIRRIAYEHQLEWRDELVRRALDESADVALWRDGKGTLKYWAIALTRNGYAKLMQEAGTIALKDKQLSLAGKIAVDSTELDVYALDYAPNRTLLLASRGDRLIALSDPGMLLNEERQVAPDAAKILANLLTSDGTKNALWAQSLNLPASTAQHSVAARAHYLSFGYQKFFPALQALRFDFGDAGWSTHALINGKELDVTAFAKRDVWSAFPEGAAACALVPVDWALTQSLLEEATAADGQRIAEVAREFEGPATVCWYGKGRIHAPLFAATLKQSNTKIDAMLGSVFDWSVKQRGKTPSPTVAAKRGDDEFVWQRKLDAPFVAVSKEGPDRGGLKVTLARKGRYVVFSPDAARVDQALQTLNKRYPSSAESLPENGVVMATIAPASLSELAQREATFMLPRSQEPVLRPIAEKRLWPRLAAMKKYSGSQLVLQEPLGAERKWVELVWTAAKP